MVDEITKAIKDACFEAYWLGYEAGVKKREHGVTNGMYHFVGSFSVIDDALIIPGEEYYIRVSTKKVRYKGRDCIEVFIKRPCWNRSVRCLYQSEDTFRDNWEKLD